MTSKLVDLSDLERPPRLTNCLRPFWARPFDYLLDKARLSKDLQPLVANFYCCISYSYETVLHDSIPYLYNAENA